MKADRTALAAVIGGAALGILALPGQANAALITTSLNAPLSSAAVVATFGGGVGTLSFTSASTGYGPGAAVATGGNAQVAMIFGGVADYGVGTLFDGSASYATSTTAAVIPFSAADDFIGFTYVGTDGTHYGYAEVFGPSLVGYAYQTTAGASITANPITPNAVPEPASAVMLVAGLAGAVTLARRGRRNTGPTTLAA